MNLPFRKPSLKKLQEAFGGEQGRRLREAMDKADSLRKALNQADMIIGGHGIEHIDSGHNRRSPAIDYVNMGDPYITTIMAVNGNLVVGNWGSYVESGSYD